MDPLSGTASVLDVTILLIQAVALNQIARDSRKEVCKDLAKGDLLRPCLPSVWRAWRLIDNIVLPGDTTTTEKFRLSCESDCTITAVGVSCCMLSFSRRLSS